jgi:GT2 family glycosyltransferase
MRVESLSSLITNLYDLNTDSKPNLIFQIGGYVSINRNSLVQEAINANGTHIMFIDTDMIFPKDAIRKLALNDKEIVAGNYNIRLGPLSKEQGGTVVTFFDTITQKAVHPLKVPKKPFKCYTLGTGFMLIDLKVFKKIKYPWFVSWQDKTGEHTTEDVDFCKKAHKAGYDVWCDPTIPISHIGQCLY